MHVCLYIKQSDYPSKFLGHSDWNITWKMKLNLNEYYLIVPRMLAEIIPISWKVFFAIFASEIQHLIV